MKQLVIKKVKALFCFYKATLKNDIFLSAVYKTKRLFEVDTFIQKVQLGFSIYMMLILFCSILLLIILYFEGNLVDWWSSVSKEQYIQKTKCIIGKIRTFGL